MLRHLTLFNFPPPAETYTLPYAPLSRCRAAATDRAATA